MDKEGLRRELLLSSVADCGCLEEEWLVDGLCVSIHFEEDERGPFADVFVDAGDWDVTNRHAGSPDIAREAAFAFIESWPTEAELEARRAKEPTHG